METIKLNVSGKLYTVGKQVLQRYPKTTLGRLTEDATNYDPDTKEYFFDRNPKMVLPILDMYRTGELHLPCNLCSLTIRNELTFWGVPEDLISECCWKRYSALSEDLAAVDIIEKALIDPLDDRKLTDSLRARVYLTLEIPTYSRASKVWFIIYISMVVVAVATAVISMSASMRTPMSHLHPGWNETSLLDMLLNTEMRQEIYLIDLVCLLFFSFELLLRFSLTPARWRFFTTPLNAMDLALIVVMWLSVILDHVPVVEHAQMAHTILRALFCLNILRIFHIGKTSDGVKLLIFTITSSIEAFGLLLVSMTMAIVIYATMAYFAEVATHADTFENIPTAVWWAVITMTTVGYGDYYPRSWPGYLVGIVCALSGILLLALPIAIIASNFNMFYSNMSSAQQRIRRRKLLSEMKEKGKGSDCRLQDH